jgi:hypothetical protein
MAARAKHRGHPIEWYGNKWIYTEGKQHGKYGVERPCVHCHAASNVGGPDRCLGDIAGVRAACCGHGEVEEAYFVFDDGTELRGFDALRLKAAWVDNQITPSEVAALWMACHCIDLLEAMCRYKTMTGCPMDMLLDASKVFDRFAGKSLDIADICGILEVKRERNIQ